MCFKPANSIARCPPARGRARPKRSSMRRQVGEFLNLHRSKHLPPSRPMSWGPTLAHTSKTYTRSALTRSKLIGDSRLGVPHRCEASSECQRTRPEAPPLKCNRLPATVSVSRCGTSLTRSTREIQHKLGTKRTCMARPPSPHGGSPEPELTSWTPELTAINTCPSQGGTLPQYASKWAETVVRRQASVTDPKTIPPTNDSPEPSEHHHAWAQGGSKGPATNPKPNDSLDKRLPDPPR